MFNYANRAALVADGWSFIATTPAGGTRDTEQSSGAVVSYDQTAHPGALRIPVDVGDLWANANNSRNSLFRNLSTNWTSLRLQLRFAPTVHLQQAHLVLYQDDNNYVSAVWSYFEPMNGRVVSLINENGGQSSPWSPRDYRATNTVVTTNIHLRLDRDLTTDFITVLYSTNGTTWNPVHTTSQVLTNTKVAIWAGGSASGFPNCDLVRLDVITSDTALQPMLHTQPRQLVFNVIQGEAYTNRQEVQVILRRGLDSRNWNVATNATWLSVSANSGTTPGTVDAFVNSTSLAVGRYNGRLNFTGSGLVSNHVDVVLIVNPNNRVRTARWGEGFSGALSVSTDDSYDSGSSQLYSNDMRGTFYLWGLTAAPSWVPGFQSSGMELGTHTISHPCFVINEPALRYELEASITLVANGAGIAPGAVLSHCWPCGFVHTRGRAIAGDYFLSARGYNINQFEDPTPHDYMNLKSFNSHEHNPFPPDDFKTLVDGAVVERKWFNLVLHAFNNDDGAIAYAAGKDLWIKPVGDVVKYMVQRDRTIVTNYTASVTQIRFDAYRLPMPAVLFRNFETNLTANDRVTFEVDVTGHPSVGALTVEGTTTPYMVRDVGAKRILYFSTTLTTNFGNRTVILTLSNNTPVAVSQWVNTAEGVATNITLVGTSRVGHGLGYAIVDQPTRGVLSGTPPNVTYTPDSGWHGGDSFRFRVTDTVSSLMATGTVSISITPNNQPPVLPAQDNRIIAEQTTLAVTNIATDADLPADYLSYRLLNPPTGATISSAGVITWTPTEGQGPGVYNIITVADDAVASVTNNFTVTVNEVNVAPVLPAQSNRNIAEFGLLTVTNQATDADLPANLLSYALTAHPAGATINANGVIQWTPDESQGPGTHEFRTVATDNGVPPLSVTNTFFVQVSEVNQVPVLPEQTNRVAGVMSLLTVTNTATDPDFPANGLTYNLLTPPAGAAIDAQGVITWTPGGEFVNTTNVIVTRVEDDGTPPFSATNSFAVVVLQLGPPPVFATNPPDVTLDEHTLLAVTNLAASANEPAGVVTYELVGAPVGAQIDTNGVITWTPNEAQGPGTNVIVTVATDAGVKATNTFTVIVTEVNVAPAFVASPDNLTIAEHTTLMVTNLVTDADLPANALGYELVAAPAGAAIDFAGVITWMTGEAEGPSTNVFVTVVTDGEFSVTNSFTVTVTEVNIPPVFAATPEDGTIAEHSTLTVTNNATDADLPANGLTYDLLAAPSGAAIDVAGVISWVTGEADGPGTNVFTTVVSDGEFSVTNSFTVIVTEVNAAPVLPAPVDRFIAELEGLIVTNTATDGDLPANPLQYQLINPPAGANITGSGVIIWQPTVSQGGTTNLFVTAVSDGTASATNQFSVVVADTYFTAITNVTLVATGSVWKYLDTGVDQGTAWRASAFDATAWSSGPAQLGFGDGDEATVVSFGGNPTAVHTTTYFRHGFDLTGRTNLSALQLRVLRDDGVVIYLNGLEIFRDNLPAGEITYNTFASSGIGGSAESTFTNASVPGVQLSNGWNVVAAEVHQNQAASSDLSFDFELTATEIVIAPALPAQTNRTVAELTLLTVTNRAVDPDTLEQNLEYQLVAPPPGAQIDTQGVITWSPAEDQGPGVYTLTTVVTDGILSTTNFFEVTVLEANQPPAFEGTPADRMIAELTTLTLTNRATDGDLPANQLTYHLIPAEGSWLSFPGPTLSSEGVFEWTPAEMQGPSTNRFFVVAEDDGNPPLSVTNSFEVVVMEVNAPPALPVQSDRVIDELALLVVTNAATDLDWPTNTLSYQLLEAPDGAGIDGAGVITWTPPATHGPSTNEFVTVVTDNGFPPFSATNNFVVTVQDSVVLPFAIASITADDQHIIVTWEATPGRSYRLQTKNNLSDPDWTDLGMEILAVTATASATNSLDGAMRKFYRVRLLP